MDEEKEKKLSIDLQVDENLELSRKMIGLILLSLTDIKPDEFIQKAKELAQEIIKKWYKT